MPVVAPARAGATATPMAATSATTAQNRTGVPPTGANLAGWVERDAATLHALMVEVEHGTLANGLPLVRLAMPGTRAVTGLVAFEAGARTERAEENGMAHFLEHLVFKGGEKFPSYRDVNETTHGLGAQLNAYTSHDLVAFHITCRSEAAMSAVDLLTDFVGRARIDAEELDRERGVAVQEIARSDDQPSSVADRLLHQATYGDHPLGRRLLRPAEHPRTVPR